MNPTNQSDTQRVHQMLLDVQARIQGFRYAQQLVAPQLAPAFSLMDYLRGNERAISEYLGMLLDTQGPHGQGDLFWRPFAELLCTTQGQARWVRNSKRRKITLEKITDDGRFLDIHIQSDGGCIAIENKPWAQDQELQLADYANYMERASGGQPWLLIYLSDRAPSESSIDIPKRKQHEGAGQFMQLNWTQVLDWLRACSPHVQAPKVRLFVESLSDYIRRHIKYEQEEAVMSQVLQVISTTPQSVETAMGIAQSIPELQKVLLRQLHDSLRGACDEKNIRLQWDESLLSLASKTGFELALDLEKGIWLRFDWFDFKDAGSLNMYYGIFLHKRASRLAEEERTEIFACLDKWMPGGKPEAPQWAWWIRLKNGLPKVHAGESGMSSESWATLHQHSTAPFYAAVLALHQEVRTHLQSANLLPS